MTFKSKHLQISGVVSQKPHLERHHICVVVYKGKAESLGFIHNDSLITKPDRRQTELLKPVGRLKYTKSIPPDPKNYGTLGIIGFCYGAAIVVEVFTLPFT